MDSKQRIFPNFKAFHKFWNCPWHLKNRNADFQNNKNDSVEMSLKQLTENVLRQNTSSSYIVIV